MGPDISERTVGSIQEISWQPVHAARSSRMHKQKNSKEVKEQIRSS